MLPLQWLCDFQIFFEVSSHTSMLSTMLLCKQFSARCVSARFTFLVLLGLLALGFPMVDFEVEDYEAAPVDWRLHVRSVVLRCLCCHGQPSTQSSAAVPSADHRYIVA